MRASLASCLTALAVATTPLLLPAQAPSRIAASPLAVPQAAGCSRCGWRLPQAATERRVRTVAELEAAVRQARPNTTVLIEPGVYHLNGSLDVTAPNVTLGGASGDRAAVVLRGSGMTEQRVGVAVSISAANVTIADLTIGYVSQHGVQIRGERGASRATLHNVRVADTGQQLVKGSLGMENPPHADGGLIACSILEYTDHAPSAYTNGIDVIGSRGWTVRDNVIRRVRGPAGGGWRAGPAVLFWGNSLDTVVERNVVDESYRGIAFGIGPGATAYRRDGVVEHDHQGGVIRDNTICNPHRWADEGIELNAARGARVEGNAVFLGGGLPWSVSVRFPTTSASVVGNVLSARVAVRDRAHAQEGGNHVSTQAARSRCVAAGAGPTAAVPGGRP